MSSLSTDKHVSPWVDTHRPQQRPVATTLPDTPADVVVIGAGVVGLTTAVLLQQRGSSVTVVDAGRFGECVTTHSTVKLTVGHGTTYSKIARTRGLEAAQVYAAANRAGFDQVLDLAGTLGIDCLLEHGLPHVVYTTSAEQVQQIEDEAALAHQLGLEVELSREAPVPFPVERAVSFAEQAQFHPGRYLSGLAGALTASGGALVEGAQATGVRRDGDCWQVATTAGELSAPHVVVATQYPILNRGAQFAQLKTRRSYGVAGVLPPGVTAGMTISAGSPTHSTRTARLDDQDLLVVVGEGHSVGHVTETEQRWDRLREWAREHFGVEQFRYHWSAEEVSTLDGLPFVGHIAPGSSGLLVATGFDGWGITNGTAAAMMLRDIVRGHDNPWLATFDARRALTSLPPIVEFVKHNLHVAKSLVTGRVAGAEPGSPEDLQPGDAAVLEVEGKQAGVYRDVQGELHAVSAVCTHMRCTVAWNAGETSWDCPCHGSRFSHTGEVLHGPASTPLERLDLKR